MGAWCQADVVGGETDAIATPRDRSPVLDLVWRKYLADSARYFLQASRMRAAIG